MEQKQVNREQIKMSLKKVATPLALLAVTSGILLLGSGLLRHAQAQTNDVALAMSPKLVQLAGVTATTFRPWRRYIGAVQPWTSAGIGPQLVSAYVESVHVRPGDVVHKGQVLATLDCRERGAARESLAAQQKALSTQQTAQAREAKRLTALVGQQFVAANDAEQKLAASETLSARVTQMHAELQRNELAVDDCTLRAPFDGEVAERLMDPGTFVRPGQHVLTLIDRAQVRVTAAVPEADFAHVAPETAVGLHFLANDQRLDAKVSRRAPQADPQTRLIELEIDIDNALKTLPVGTTVELALDVGEPQKAQQIPLSAATVRSDKATVYLLDGKIAKRKVLLVLGERAGQLFVRPDLPVGAQVVTEGRTTLHDGDRVQAGL